MAMGEGMGVMPVYNLDGGNKNEGGMGGGFIWIILLIILLGFGKNGLGGGDNAATSTQSQISNDFLSNQVGQGFAQVTNQNFATQKDIASGFAGIGNAVCDSTYALNNSIKDGNFALMSSIDRSSCETNRNIDSVRFGAERNTCEITNAIHADGEATRALINSNTMQDLRDRLAATELGLSQAAQTANIVAMVKPCPIPAYPTCNPWASPSCGTC
jgi:hypothetical protein